MKRSPDSATPLVTYRTIAGCVSPERIAASCSKRTASRASRPVRIFTATVAPSVRSRARYTVPMPPEPASASS